jgi:DnaK suppressor protein
MSGVAVEREWPSFRIPAGLRWLRRGEGEARLVRVGVLDIQSVLEVVEAEQERTARQVASLEDIVAAIVEGSELTSTDDEHDPEGATIAYERAQASALLRRARADCDALVVTRRQLERRQRVICVVCRRDIDLERVAALPTTSRCVRCAA